MYPSVFFPHKWLSFATSRPLLHKKKFANNQAAYGGDQTLNIYALTIAADKNREFWSSWPLKKKQLGPILKFCEINSKGKVGLATCTWAESFNRSFYSSSSSFPPLYLIDVPQETWLMNQTFSREIFIRTESVKKIVGNFANLFKYLPKLQDFEWKEL